MCIRDRRGAIARALMQEPKIVFADEPVASLDPKAGEEVMELLHSLGKERGLTILFCTHHLDHAKQFSDRVIGLKDGEIEFDQSSAEFDPDSLRGFYDKKF